MRQVIKLNDKDKIIVTPRDSTKKECSNLHKPILYFEKDKTIVTLHNGTKKECSNLHKAILYLIKR